MKRIALIGLLLAGCLDVTEGPTPMCEQTSDCDAVNGEVCDNGTCYGNPPSGSFAAVVSPPSGSTLVARQVLGFTIPLNGRFADVHLDDPIVVAGTVVGCVTPLPCTSTSLAATITVTGKPEFPGGPSYLSVVDAPDTNGYTLRLPRSRTDHEYDVIVQPAGRDAEPGATGTPAQFVPPFHVTLAAEESLAAQILDLGTSPENYQVAGKIATSGGAGVSNYRVVALGHWDEDAPLVEVSTVDYTSTNGEYRIRLAAGLAGAVQIVATSYGTSLRPSLALAGVSSQKASVDNDFVLPERPGVAHDNYQVTVRGVDGSGAVVPVAGAHVIITGQLAHGDASALLTAESTTDEHGVAKKLALLDGADFATTYLLTVVPPANSSNGVVIDKPVTLAELGQPVRLPDRLALHGVVRDSEGNPVKDISVTARPSVTFLWSLPPPLQAVLSTIPPATTVTPESGEFVVFVDRALADIWGHYDLAFDGTSSSALPSYQSPVFDVPRDAAVLSIALPDVALPEAAYVHGDVVDPMGLTVEGAELKVYELPSVPADFCDLLPYRPTGCPVPARLLGRGASSESGELRLILPR